eukprot:m51a1_g3556 hypothetical protein (665) ;mRNA; f:1033738-1036635
MSGCTNGCAVAGCATLDTVPAHVVEAICDHLDEAGLCAVCGSCRRLRSLASSDALWRRRGPLTMPEFVDEVTRPLRVHRLSMGSSSAGARHRLKMLLLGESAVGKTLFAQSVSCGPESVSCGPESASPTALLRMPYIPTICLNIYKGTNVESGESGRGYWVEVDEMGGWGVGGLQRELVIEGFVRSADVVVVCFSVGSPDSLSTLPTFLSMAAAGHRSAVCVLGLQADRRAAAGQGCVGHAEARVACARLRVPFIGEASVLDRQSVEQAYLRALGLAWLEDFFAYEERKRGLRTPPTSPQAPRDRKPVVMPIAATNTSPGPTYGLSPPARAWVAAVPSMNARMRGVNVLQGAAAAAAAGFSVPVPVALPARPLSPQASPLESTKSALRSVSAPAGGLLSLNIKDFFLQGPQTQAARMVLVPHGPFDVCGQLVASAFKSIPRNTETVIVIGPAHRRPSAPCALTAFGALETPAGVVAVDIAANSALIDTALFTTMPERLDREEYSIESLLPFLRVAAPKATALPVLVGDCNTELSRVCGTALATIARSRNTVIVVSCDLAHWGAMYRWTGVDPRFGTGEAAIRATVSDLDRALIDTICTASPEELSRHPSKSFLCRHNAVTLALHTAKAAGWKLSGSLVAHCVESGPDLTFVGHASIAFHEQRSR